MLAKKYYEMIARTVRETRLAVTSRDKDATDKRLWALDQMSEALAHEFEIDSPRFDRARFLQACGVAS